MASKHKRIDGKEFVAIKHAIKVADNLEVARKRVGVSRTTVVRVNTAKTFAEYKEILVKDHPSKYKNKRREYAWKIGEQPPVVKKDGWFTRFLKFLDIKV